MFRRSGKTFGRRLGFEGQSDLLRSERSAEPLISLFSSGGSGVPQSEGLDGVVTLRAAILRPPDLTGKQQNSAFKNVRIPEAICSLC